MTLFSVRSIKVEHTTLFFCHYRAAEVKEQAPIIANLHTRRRVEFMLARSDLLPTRAHWQGDTPCRGTEVVDSRRESSTP